MVRRRLGPIAVALAVIAFGACSASDDPADADRPPGDDRPQPATDVDIDLAGQRDDPEIATLLDFVTGAGGIGPCDAFASGDDGYYQEVAFGVGVANGLPDEHDHRHPIGFPVSICVATVHEAVTGTITPPGGDPVAIPGPRATERAGPVEATQAEPVDGTGTVVLATFPGAPVGDYTVELTDGSNRVTFSLELRPAAELGEMPDHFQYGKYAEDYPAGSLEVSPGDDVELGFVGHEPGSSGVYFLYRAEQAEPGRLPIGTYTLVDRLEVAFDRRGEAALRVPTATSPERTCYVLLERTDALTDVAEQDRIAISGAHAAAFCVGDDRPSPTSSVLVDDCGELDAILDSFELPAGGHTFCSGRWGVVLSYHASNYGFTVYGSDTTAWEELAAMNLGERPVVDLLTSVGFVDEVAHDMCLAVEPYASGPDLGC